MGQFWVWAEICVSKWKNVRIVIECGSFQKEVWQCICSNIYAKMQYVATFRKQVWQECPNQKEGVAVICLHTLSFQMANQASSCICIR